MDALSIGGALVQQQSPETGGPAFAMLNSDGHGGDHWFHILEKVEVSLEALKSSGEAIEINSQYKKWSDELDELQDCAENPTNPATINEYAQDPGQEEQILSQIAQGKSELAELTVARLVNVAIAFGAAAGVGIPLLSLIAVLDEEYSGDALEELSEQQVTEIMQLVTSCTTTTSSSTSSTTLTSTKTFTSTESSTETATGTTIEISGVIYGAFTWSEIVVNSGQALTEYASGTFQVTVDPQSDLATGSGSGQINDHFQEPSQGCSGSGELAYTFSVGGTYLPYPNTIELGFLPSNPANVTFTVTCTNPSGQFKTSTPFTTVHPTEVNMQTVDGAVLSASSPQEGETPASTYQITLSAHPVTETLTTTFPTETTITSVETTTATSVTSTETSTEESSTTSGTTLITGTISNSTSTG